MSPTCITILLLLAFGSGFAVGWLVCRDDKSPFAPWDENTEDQDDDKR